MTDYTRLKALAEAADRKAVWADTVAVRGARRVATVGKEPSDVAFIAAADPTTVLGLIAEVERLRGLLKSHDDLRKHRLENPMHSDTWDALAAEAHDARADVERLTRERDEARDRIKQLHRIATDDEHEHMGLAVGQEVACICSAFNALRAAVAERPDITRADTVAWQRITEYKRPPYATPETFDADCAGKQRVEAALRAHALGTPPSALIPSGEGGES